MSSILKDHGLSNDVMNHILLGIKKAGEIQIRDLISDIMSDIHQMSENDFSNYDMTLEEKRFLAKKMVEATIMSTNIMLRYLEFFFADHHKAKNIKKYYIKDSLAEIDSKEWDQKYLDTRSEPNKIKINSKIYEVIRDYSNKYGIPMDQVINVWLAEILNSRGIKND
jgi:hypothetical protein